MQFTFLAAALLALICTAEALRCYECNVWKAGYGHLCNNPRIRDDCIFCMKLETKIYVGYYKNKPRNSTIHTRVCAISELPHFSTECLKYKSADGYSERCFCDTDLCNSATWQKPPALMWLLLPAGLLGVLNRLWHWDRTDGYVKLDVPWLRFHHHFQPVQMSSAAEWVSIFIELPV